MAWPSTVTLTQLDDDADSPLSARPQIKAMGDAVNDIIGERGVASGIASLDSSGTVPNTEIPDTITTTGSNDITLVPNTERVKIQNIINLEPRTVAQLTALTGDEGDVAYCSNGDTGSKCIAVYNGTNWVVVSLGSTISAT